jgi:hypothetical protein
MKIVIQCAGSKFENAGRLETSSGEKVLFVAHAEKYSGRDKCFRPDDVMEESNVIWRNYLKAYNEKGLNPNDLFPDGGLFTGLSGRLSLA